MQSVPGSYARYIFCFRSSSIKNQSSTSSSSYFNQSFSSATGNHCHLRVQFAAHDRMIIWFLSRMPPSKRMETICRHFHKNYDRRTRFLSMIWWLVVTFLIAAKPATSFLRHAIYPQTIIANFSNRSELRCARTVSTTPENDALYKELC